jgi:hypothetical protein
LGKVQSSLIFRHRSTLEIQAFVFSLDSILKEAGGGLSMNPRASSDELEVDAQDPWSIFVKSIWNAVDGTLNEAGSRFSISPRASVDDTAIVDELEARTKLDRGQC